MSIRLYLSPIVGDGLSTETAFRAKIADVVQGHSAQIPNNPDGSMTFTWALALARAADWTAADADATLSANKLFDSADLPDTVQTWADMKAFLQSKTVADIPAARRQTLNTLLTNHGMDTSQVTLATTWWAVLRGVVKFLNGGVLPATEMGIA